MARKTDVDVRDLEWIFLLEDNLPGDALNQLIRNLIEKVPSQQQWKQATDAWLRNNPAAKKYDPSAAEAIATLARKVARGLVKKSVKEVLYLRPQCKKVAEEIVDTPPLFSH